MGHLQQIFVLHVCLVQFCLEKVILQVMNVSSMPVTIYKSMNLGEATPIHNVLLVDDNVNDVTATQEDGLQTTDFNIAI